LTRYQYFSLLDFYQFHYNTHFLKYWWVLTPIDDICKESGVLPLSSQKPKLHIVFFFCKFQCHLLSTAFSLNLSSSICDSVLEVAEENIWTILK
jgi:hypothetical protein